MVKLREFTAYVQPSNPAAGAALTYTAPHDMKILGVKIRLVTDATVANRRMALQMQQGSDELPRAQSSTDITASLTRQINFSSFHNQAETASGGTYITVPINPIILRSGDDLIITASGLQAADQLSACEILFTN